MITVISKKQDIDRAQGALRERLRREASRQDSISVTHQGATHTEQGVWFGRPRLWAILSVAEDRWWNAFGLYFPFDEVQNIALEINPPFDGIRRSVAGAFGTDDEGRIYLLHRGNLVHLKGFKKESFLTYYGRDDLVEVRDGGQRARVILVGALDSDTFLDEVAAFVRLVSDFKETLRETGESPTSRPRQTPSWATDFNPEHDEDSGRRPLPPVVVRRTHGRVLNALARVLSEAGHHVANDRARDLFLLRPDGTVSVLFELKTTSLPSDVYTAIGQLLFHGELAGSLVAVLPAEDLDPAVTKRLASLGIQLVRWRLSNDGIVFQDLDHVLPTVP